MIETREKDGIFLFVYLYYYDFVWDMSHKRQPLVTSTDDVSLN